MSEFIKKYFGSTVKFQPEDKESLIGLPYPYTTLCVDEMFLEMYYWDTYFINVGLIANGDVEQAKNNTDNVRFLIEKYGFMPNGNRIFYLGNTQPPFYYKMVEDVSSHIKDIYGLEVSDSLVSRTHSTSEYQNRQFLNVTLNCCKRCESLWKHRLSYSF